MWGESESLFYAFQNYMRLWKDDNESCHSWIISSDFFLSLTFVPQKKIMKNDLMKKIHEGLIFLTLSTKQAHLLAKHKPKIGSIVTYWVGQAGINSRKQKDWYSFPLWHSHAISYIKPDRNLNGLIKQSPLLHGLKGKLAGLQKKIWTFIERDQEYDFPKEDEILFN